MAMTEKQQAVLDRIQFGAVTVPQIVRSLGGDANDPAERQRVRSVLQKLEKQGVVRRDQQRWEIKA